MYPTQSARIRCRTRQDDCSSATQTNDRVGCDGCSHTASVQAKDPKGAENEGNSKQRHSRQTECEAHAVHSSGAPRNSGLVQNVILDVCVGDDLVNRWLVKEIP